MQNKKQPLQERVSPLQAPCVKNRAKLLESRLEPTEDLVQTLKDDLNKTRKAMMQLPHNNVHLCSEVEKGNKKREINEQTQTKKIETCVAG